ncbi:hypothetical protein Q2T40_08305 [Winogradskyella maritima]|uniref:Uncharacterized protein n=1 Tax=Winogradskyella maritima TaxID=1517766 RepID=A0ABV8AKA0_9FLAO|nr:hypothetical protein [Winogradskyella maritima]
MDELELLKKDWNATSNDFQTYDDADLYRMSHRKSSSIVKTLFYISVGELLFWVLLNYVPMLFFDTFRERMEELMHDNLYVGLSIFGYLVIGVFAFLLWKSYKSISVTDSSKKLMESILNTRKIIKYYVLYNLVVILISIPFSVYSGLQEDADLAEKVASFDSGQLTIMYSVIIGFTAIFLVLVWLFYKLIYGILINRLNKNYAELKKIED